MPSEQSSKLEGHITPGVPVPDLSPEQQIGLSSIREIVEKRTHLSPDALLGYLNVYHERPKLIQPGLRAAMRIEKDKNERGHLAS